MTQSRYTTGNIIPGLYLTLYILYIIIFQLYVSVHGLGVCIWECMCLQVDRHAGKSRSKDMAVTWAQ